MLPRVPRKYTVKDVLDTQPEFKEWIEQTKLFNVLVELTSGKTLWESFGGVQPTIVSSEINISLIAGVVIKTPYDLPLELIGQFYMNSPFFDSDLASRLKTGDTYSPHKLIDNG